LIGSGLIGSNFDRIWLERRIVSRDPRCDEHAYARSGHHGGFPRHSGKSGLGFSSAKPNIHSFIQA
jgi:hypothetical protein